MRQYTYLCVVEDLWRNWRSKPPPSTLRLYFYYCTARNYTQLRLHSPELLRRGDSTMLYRLPLSLGPGGVLPSPLPLARFCGCKSVTTPCDSAVQTHASLRITKVPGDQSPSVRWVCVPTGGGCRAVGSSCCCPHTSRRCVRPPAVWLAWCQQGRCAARWSRRG
jgi:hypothetical protein